MSPKRPDAEIAVDVAIGDWFHKPTMGITRTKPEMSAIKRRHEAQRLSHTGHVCLFTVEDVNSSSQTLRKKEFIVTTQDRVLGPNQVASFVESLMQSNWPVHVVEFRPGADRFLDALWYRLR